MGWPTCFHVAGSRIVLQCLATTTKSVIVYWSRYLPLVHWKRWRFSRIVEKEISLPDICCSKGYTWDKPFENHTHLVQHWVSFSILTHVNSSKSKDYSVKTFEKTSIKFHVPSLRKSQKVLLILGNIGRSITDENSFHFLLSKHCFSKHCSLQKFQASFFLFMSSCQILQSEISCRNPVKYNV